MMIVQKPGLMRMDDTGMKQGWSEKPVFAWWSSEPPVTIIRTPCDDRQTAVGTAFQKPVFEISVRRQSEPCVYQVPGSVLCSYWLSILTHIYTHSPLHTQAQSNTNNLIASAECFKKWFTLTNLYTKQYNKISLTIFFLVFNEIFDAKME